MANRYKAFVNTLVHEDGTLSGVVAIDSNGAKVRWGVNQKSWPSVDVPNLSFQEAIKVCYASYWPNGLAGVMSQTVANAVFDLEFNNGRTNGVRMLQRALGLEEDGVIGPKTIGAANADKFLESKLAATIEQHYRDIAAKNPAEAKYLEIWLARLRENFQ